MITANGPHILCRIAQARRLTDAGLLLPDLTTSEGKLVGQNKANTQEAVVVSVGPDAQTTAKPGDRILYEKFAGTTIELAPDDQYLVLNADHLIALLED